jgi:hypothetical protein
MEEITMKKFSKGMVITSTVAAALAALTFAGCGSTEIAPKAAPTNTNASAVQVIKNEEASKPAAAVNAEAVEEKTTEKTAAKKNSKKKSKKKKAADKASEKTAEPAQQNVQPIVVVPTVQVQPTVQTQPAAQPQPVAETPASTQAPAAAIPDDVYPVWVEGDVYAGSYYEETAGRGMMDITRNSDGTYSVEVNWASNASEKNIWNFTGEFNGRGLMNYYNCRKTTVAFDENGNYTYDSYGLMTPYTTYTMGSGYIEFKDEGVLEWHDDMGDILPGTRFVSKTAYNKANVPNTKANEAGTAGSNYVEETTATELPTGWLYDGNGSKTIMNITKNGDSYKFVVSMPDERGTCYHTYSFSGKLENGKVSYTGGQQDDLVYNADNSVKSAKFVSNDHKGQVSLTNTGIVWNDSYGPHFVFISRTM